MYKKYLIISEKNNNNRKLRIKVQLNAIQSNGNTF